MTEMEQVLTRLAKLEERSLAHTESLAELTRLTRHIDRGMAGIKAKVAVFASIFGAAISAVTTYLLKGH